MFLFKLAKVLIKSSKHEKIELFIKAHMKFIRSEQAGR